MFVYSLDDIQSVHHPIDSWSSIQFGISYISSFLKEHGHETNLLVLGSNSRWGKNVQLLSSLIEEFNPDLICYTAVFSQYRFIERIAKLVKSQWPDKFNIIGGVHSSLNPLEVSKGPFDAICIGEGEYPILELSNNLAHKESLQKIPNLWVKLDDGKFKKNETRNFNQNLDELPFPDREMWKPWIKERKNDELAILLGRGCPYECTYCSNHALRKISHGKYVRVRSVENILKEISLLYETYQHRKIYLEIETIAANKNWTMEFCSKLKEFNHTINNAISFGCNFRISSQSMDETLFIALKEANFHKIHIGLESGSENIRSEVLKRSYSNEDFLNTVSMARKHGLDYYIYNMIGIPGETLKDHMKTVLLNRQCQPAGHYTGIFFPYPGTKLYNICIKQNLLKNSLNSNMERNRACLDLSTFSKRQIQSCLNWFNYRIYKGYQPFWKLYVPVIKAKIKYHPKISFLIRRILQFLN